MPLPWKKAKVTRISRIVADLQSPKRGGSLVVETGFPTSLIDLFVKNHDRLKKPSRKKKKKIDHNNDNNNNTQIDVRVPDPIAANSDIRVGPRCDEVENLSEPEEIEASLVVEASGSSLVAESENPDVEERAGGNSRGGALMAVLKVFSVVVLALSTKKLTVGITLSAFFLLFLEYVGKRSILFLRPCSKMEVTLKSMVQWVSAFFRFKKDLLMVGEDFGEGEKEASSSELVNGTELKSSIEEIEIVEPNNGLNIEVSRGPELELLSRDKKWGFLDTSEKAKETMEDGEVLVLDKIKSSKRAKIKAKLIKNFVPKKLRRSRKAKQSKENIELETSSEASSCHGYEKGGRFEEQEEETPELEPRKEIEKGVHEEISASDEVFHGEKELSVVIEEEGREERNGNWVYLTLILIVLAGLFGGRIMALLLTIAWCFMLKLIRTLQRRSRNMTKASSSFAISS